MENMTQAEIEEQIGIASELINLATKIKGDYMLARGIMDRASNRRQELRKRIEDEAAAGTTASDLKHSTFNQLVEHADDLYKKYQSEKLPPSI